MANKNSSLLNSLTKKNIKDTVILGIVTVIIVAIILFVVDTTMMIYSTVGVLLFYFIQYQVSRNELLKSMDKLIDNELKEFQNVSTKVLQLSEKQRQLTNKYIEMLNNVVQTAKLFKNSALKSKEKTQGIALKMQEAYEDTNRGSREMESNLDSLNNLKHKVQNIAELIIELADYIKQIGSTVNVVENISEQTNMLALNAAVEAARAGEYGKGFAVVAGEIRKLADESKQATNKITTLVSEIEQTTSATIMATEDGTKEMENSVRFASSINNNIVSIINKIKDLSININDILTNSIEEQTITNEVLETVDNMQKGISESVITLEENIENIRKFSEISLNIQDNISK